VTTNPPFDENAWELYNLNDDPTERIDLAKKYPEKLAQLKAEFEQQAQSHHLYPTSPSTMCMPTLSPHLPAQGVHSAGPVGQQQQQQVGAVLSLTFFIQVTADDFNQQEFHETEERTEDVDIRVILAVGARLSLHAQEAQTYQGSLAERSLSRRNGAGACESARWRPQRSVDPD